MGDFFKANITIEYRKKTFVYVAQYFFPPLYIFQAQKAGYWGAPVVVLEAGSRGANVHMIGCFGPLGLLHIESRHGSFKKEVSINSKVLPKKSFFLVYAASCGCSG